MSDVSSWLVEHGLGQYAETFEASDITIDLLPELNQDDLKELGLSLGHQKKLLRAVQSQFGDGSTDVNPLQSTHSPDASIVPNGSPPSPTSSYPQSGVSTSERRQLTVMFCDLADSTQLVSQIGAEEMQDLYRDYQAICVRAVNRYNGYVATYLGDGVMVYFGYPQARERDADRCIRAGLLLLELLKPLNVEYNRRHGIEVAVRIGIATGPVVVGDIIGEGASMQASVVGETPNLAARIQGLGGRNSVTVSNLTYRLTASSFDFVDRGQHTAKGIVKPVQIWGAIRPRRTQNPVTENDQMAIKPMIGRREELQLLQNALGDAAVNGGRLVCVSGEAGIGKSHLIETFLQEADIPQGRVARLLCSPYYTGSVLYPILDLIERDFDARSISTADVTFDELLDYFERAVDWQHDAARYFATMLSISLEDAGPGDDISPQVQQERAFDGWIDQLTPRLGESPTIILLEDAHWLDATTIALVNRLIARLNETACLLIVSSRPQGDTPWRDYQSAAINIDLTRLDRQHGIQVIERILNGSELQLGLIDLIIEKTDGVPLFIEELTKSIVSQQAKLATTDGASEAATMEIPETLNDLLMSKLDKEPSIKAIAQIGATIGRDFAYQLLASIAPHEKDELAVLLEKVVESDLVFQSGPLPASIYTFRHALLQDAAYQSLLIKNRRKLHSRIASVMEDQSSDALSHELVAHHWTEADRPDKAVVHWQLAAREASRVWANEEAVKRYRHARHASELIDASERSKERHLDILLEAGAALRAVQGSSAAETIAVFDEATECCDAVDNIDYTVRSYYGAFATHFTAAQLPQARSAGQTLLALASGKDHVAGIAAGHQALGMCDFAVGDLTSARDNLERALSFQTRYEFEFDIQYPVLSQSYLSWTLFFCDLENEALALISKAINESRSVSAYSHALAMANACYLHQFRNDIDTLATLTLQLKVFASEKGLPVWYAVAEFFDSWQLCQHTADSDSMDRLVKALAFWAEDEIETPYFKAIVAETLISNDRLIDGNRLAEEARTLAMSTGEIWYEQQIGTLAGAE